MKNLISDMWFAVRKIVIRGAFVIGLVLLTVASPVAGIAVMVMLAVVTGALFLFLPWLAKVDILVTTVKEGTAKAIMRGKSFAFFLMSFEGFHLNDPKGRKFDPTIEPWQRIEHGKPNDPKFDNRSWLLQHLGLYWIGMPWANSVHSYTFEWNETQTNAQGVKVIRPRKEQTDFVFINEFPYAVVADKVETQDLLQVDTLSIAGVRVWNPYLAMFNSEDWMTRVTAAVLRRNRNFVGMKNYKDLKTDDGKADFSEPILKLNDWLPDDDDSVPGPKGLKGRYGIEITTADLQEVELTGSEAANVQKAAAAAFTATQNATAVTTAADAKAYEITKIGTADAGALTARLDALKGREEIGLKLAGFDAIKAASENPGSQVIWGNAVEAAVSTAANLIKPKQGGNQP